ncbi:MAG TPA: hypothetical protein PKA90_13625 [Ignavibacteria bacterium]|nr:hypothetical protein [Ignavibacteria bacterium]HMR41459.1 hypothetical protein [Ignavibacteria bacterium]
MNTKIKSFSKKVALLLVLFAFLFCSNLVSSKPITSNDRFSDNLSIVQKDQSENYTYIRILKDGVWWVLVYNDQGVLIDEYAEE